MRSPVDAMSAVRLAEVFGPTVQGEGPTAGRLCSFVRFSLCNLACSFCDTPYTWDWTGINGTAYDKATELHLVDTDDVLDMLRLHGTDRVVITGGEPLVQQTALADLAVALLAADYTVEVETNGTLLPPHELTTPAEWLRWNISPKLQGSGDNHRTDPLPLEVLAWWAETQPSAVFKFVVTGDDDLQQALGLARQVGMPLERVWLMPEGRTPGALQSAIRTVADAAVDNRCNVSTRLHVLAWGDERGR